MLADQLADQLGGGEPSIAGASLEVGSLDGMELLRAGERSGALLLLLAGAG